ncbi:uncharacterized protein GIQ15_06089 [Arthroderma uncinatum]|uniref:uncharacterized protein n=1 Tax=Arthroderma uncinatum TaxID=74035 RepID=UPI00144A659B|nr:uncharacterized protein GIQ15_06089 [Arthroderma uncinatum]KAF3480742.1 hypothetical protein GIQ15_06089 [Arthroderma uncinatum]
MFRQSTFRALGNAAGLATSNVSRAFSSTARRDFARLTLVGRLGMEPEVTTSVNGREYIRYHIATSYGPRDNKQTSWFRIMSFVDGPARDNLLSLPKGTLMLVEGDASLRVVEEGEGKKSSVLNVVQRTYEVLSRPYNQNNQQENNQQES